MTTIEWRQEKPGDAPTAEGIFARVSSGLSTTARTILLVSALEDVGGVIALVRLFGEERLLSELVPAEQARLVRLNEETGQMVFIDPSVRLAVLASSTEDELRTAHRLLATVLFDHPEKQVRHMIAAGTADDLGDTEVLVTSARHAIDSGHVSAGLAGLVKAAEYSESAGDRSAYLAEAAFVSAQIGGDCSRASELLIEARRCDFEPGREPVQLAATAALLLLDRAGDVGAARSLLVGESGTDDKELDGEEHVQDTSVSWWPLMVACWFGGCPEWWESLTQSAVGQSLDSASPLALAVKAFGDPSWISPTELNRLDAVVDGLSGQSSPQDGIHTAFACLYVDRLGGCRNVLEKIVREGRSGEAAGSAIYAMFALGIERYFVGEWDEAVRITREGMVMCDQLGYRLVLWFGRYILALVAASQGHKGAVDEFAVQARVWADQCGTASLKTWADHARALQAMADGNYESAYQQLASIVEPGKVPHYVPQALWVTLDVVEAAVRTGRHAEALAHVEALRKAGVGGLSSRYRLLVDAATALVAPAPLARDLLQTALARPGADRWPFDHARIELLFAEALRVVGESNASGRHLDSAYRRFEDLGATAWCSRINLLRGATGRRHPDGEVLENALTPQEIEIACLAAAGLSNREIGEQVYLSHRTVGAHLYRIFPKLGVTTRAGLRDAFAAGRGQPVRVAG